MALFYRKKILLAEVETTYGTDPTPTGTQNAILTRDLSIQLMQGATEERNTDNTVLGGELTYHVAPYTMLTFAVELAGSGTAGVAPGWDPLLLACGFAKTINTGTSVAYAPVSSSFPSVTLYYHHDGLLHALTGARGTVTFSLSPGGMPLMNFTFTGLRVTPSDVALPSPTLTGFQVPVAVTNTNSPTFNLHSYDAVMGGFNIDIGNNVVYHNVVNSESVMITDRAVKGDVSIEESLLATKNWHTIVSGHTTGALSFVHGTTGGNIVELACPAVQLLQPSYEDSDGILMVKFNLNIIPSGTGNDEIVVTVK